MALSEVADLYIILRAVTKPFTDSMAAAGTEGEAAAGKINGGIGKISPVLLGITAATGLAAVASVKWASNFETQYTRLYTAAGASKTAVLANRDAMLQLGNATGYTGTQIAEALYHPVSAGLSLATSLQVVKYAAEEARISGANLDDTTFSLSSVMKAFNLSANDAQGTMAQLNAIVGDGDMHFQDFNTSIKNWAPTAAAMGVSIQSMGAGLAYLTDRGNTAEEASTRMTMGLTLMATPSAQAAKLLEGLGVASGDVKAGTSAMTSVLQKAHVTQNQLAKDLQQPDGLYVALQHLKTALKDAGVSGTEADSTISKIFGGGRSDKAILSLLQNLDGLKQKYDQIGKDSSAKTFQQDWENTQKTTAMQFEKLKAQVINLGTKFGEILLPALKNVMKYVTDGIGWITKHKEAMIALAGVIGGVVVAALYSMGAALVATAAEAMANPIVDIVAALALAAVEVVTHWKAVKKFFEGLWSWVMEHKMIFEIILAPLLAIVVPIVLAVKEIIKHWKGIVDFFKEVGKDLVQWGKDIGKFFEHMWDDLSKWFSDKWKDAVAAVKIIWKGLKDGWDDTVHFFERIWNDTGGKVVHEISKDWDEVTSAVSKEWKKVSDDLSSIWSSLVSIWNSTGGKLVHWIAEAMGWVSDEIHKHWDFIKTYLMAVWSYIHGAISGALSVIMGILKAAWTTITSITKMAWDVIKGIITAAWDVITGAVKGAIAIIGGILKAAWDAIKDIVKTVWDLITGIVNTALDFIKNLLKLFADFFSGHWSKLWGDVKNLFKGIWDDIYGLFKKVLGDIWNFVVGIVKDIWNGFIKGIEDALKGIGNALKDIWNAIVDFFKDAGKWLLQVGKDIINGLINGIKSMAKGAVGAVKDIGKDIVSGAKSVLSIFSPSKVFHEIGQNVGQGLINGMVSQKDGVAAALSHMTSPLSNASIDLNSSMIGPSVTSQGALAPNTINIYVQGSVLTDRDLRDVVQEQMLQLGARYSTSYTPYKR